MALTNLFNGGVTIPPPKYNTTTSTAYALSGGTSISAAGEKLALVFPVPKTGTISKITAAVGAGAPVVWTMTLETVNSAGNPSGVLYGGSASTTVVPRTGGTFDATMALSTPATATVGDLIAVVFTYVSGSSANTSYGSLNAAPQGGTVYARRFTAGAWVAILNHVGGAYGIEYSDGSYAYIQGNSPWSTAAPQIAISTATNPSQVALNFQFPVPVRISGVTLSLQTANALGNASAVFYDRNGVSQSIIPNLLSGWNSYSYPPSSANWNVVTGYFPTPIIVAANTPYRCSILPGTTNSVSLGYPTYITSAALGQEACGTSFTASTMSADGSTWVDWAMKCPLMSLIVDQVSNNSGGTTPTSVGSVS